MAAGISRKCNGYTVAINKPKDRPTVLDVRPLIQEIYQSHCAGCCLHIVTDDYNVDDYFVESCLERARERGHATCIKAAEMLVAMTKTQRLKAAKFKYAY